MINITTTIFQHLLSNQYIYKQVNNLDLDCQHIFAYQICRKYSLLTVYIIYSCDEVPELSGKTSNTKFRANKAHSVNFHCDRKLRWNLLLHAIIHLRLRHEWFTAFLQKWQSDSRLTCKCDMSASQLTCKYAISDSQLSCKGDMSDSRRTCKCDMSDSELTCNCEMSDSRVTSQTSDFL